MDNIIGKKIRNIREQKKLSRKALAEMVGVSPKTIQRYEEGENNTNIKTLQRIADALGVSISELMAAPSALNGLSSPVLEHINSGLTGSLFSPKETDSRTRLLTAFDAMTADGQQKAADIVEDLSQVPKYRKDTDKDE